MENLKLRLPILCRAIIDWILLFAFSSIIPGILLICLLVFLGRIHGQTVSIGTFPEQIIASIAISIILGSIIFTLVLIALSSKHAGFNKIPFSTISTINTSVITAIAIGFAFIITFMDTDTKLDLELDMLVPTMIPACITTELKLLSVLNVIK